MSIPKLSLRTKHMLHKHISGITGKSVIPGLREIYQKISSRLALDMAGVLPVTKFVVEP